jgi:RNA polymerase sigma-70 factor (ECF subfamily)
MRIKYEFCTDEVEIEVSPHWAAVLQELDRQEYNSNHRETRRHQQADDLIPSCPCLCAPDNVEEDVIALLESERLHRAIQRLIPRHRYLVEQVYLLGRSYSEIARETGVCRTAVKYATDRALRNLQKMLS